MDEGDLTFGPVPSRRLGRSLGINNIPPKICSYSCVYCQVGRTREMRIERGEHYPPDDLIAAVERRVREAEKVGAPIDALTFVPDGEPTLDIHLGREIAGLKKPGRRVAVISNASTIADESVRADLALADWVSLKVDAVDREIWRKVDRPHGRLDLEEILEGIVAFRRAFGGELVTETMLVGGMNDGEESVGAVAAFLGDLKPDRAYLSAPTRPPAESAIRPPDEASLQRAYQIVRRRVKNVELLVSYEGDTFEAVRGSVEEEILGITAVHPMRERAVFALLDKAGEDRSLLEVMIRRCALARVEYEGETYYLRRFLKR